MRPTTLLLLLLVTSLLAVSKNDIVGKWLFSEAYYGEYYIFQPNGTMHANMPDGGYGKWNLQGNTLTYFFDIINEVDDGSLDTSRQKEVFHISSIDSASMTYTFSKQTQKMYRAPLKRELPLSKGWRIPQNGIVHGDLTGDGYYDIARVIELPENEHREEERILQVFKGSKQGDFTLFISNENAIMLRPRVGTMDDPFRGLRYKRNSLFVDFHGGIRDRWSYTYQFLKRQGAISLIGEERTELDAITDDLVETSINYLSGKTLTKSGKEDGKMTEKWTTQGKKPLIPLKDFKGQ